MTYTVKLLRTKTASEKQWVRSKQKAIEEEAGAGVLTTVRRLQIVAEEHETLWHGLERHAAPVMSSI